MAFDENYFSTHTYQTVSFAKFSQYWWSNRFFAMLARRYGKRDSRLLEIGSGLGHLVGQLEDSFKTFGIDLNHWAVARSKSEARRTYLQTASAQDLPYADASLGVVIIKHVVEHLPDPRRALREISRVLEPGGVLILASLRQDGHDDATPTRWLRRLSGPAIVLHPMAATVVFVDWIMSTEPHWYSTMFALLILIGQILNTIAFVILLLALFRNTDRKSVV